MIATSTAHDDDFAAAVALEDLQEAKHDPFEWLHSPIKLTPLEASHRLAGTTHAEQKNTCDFDYIEQTDNVDGRRGKYIHSSRKQGGTAEDSRIPAYNPRTSNDSFFRCTFPRPPPDRGWLCRGRLIYRHKLPPTQQ